MPATLNMKKNRFERICGTMLDIYLKKNQDYGDSFSESVKKFGPIAAVVRMNDKMNRITNLIYNEAKVEDESLYNTVHDLATYCVMFMMELNYGKEDAENE